MIKVYGMTIMQRTGQYRAVVACKTQAEAARAFGVSLHEFRNYGCQTSNLREIEAAMKEPGQIFGRPLNSRDDPYININGY